MKHPSIHQLPAREAHALGVAIPYWHLNDDLPISYHLTLPVLLREDLNRLVIFCRKRSAKFAHKEFDCRADGLDYLPRDKELVNFIRHSCLNRTGKNNHQVNGYTASYDAILYRINKAGIDVENRQCAFKLSVLRLIQASYPDLAIECEYQIFNIINT